MRLPDKVAIVTGGASGLGRGIALALAREGARVAVVDLNEAGARDTVEAIAKDGGQAAAWRADISDKARIDLVVAEVIGRWGTVDILVNNAGLDRVGPFVNSGEAEWDLILRVNLKGPIVCTRAVLDEMTRKGYGKIVNIASDAGRVGSTGEAVYSAAKGGIIAFTKTIARETARLRLNVNCVCPGPSDTPLFQEVAAGNPKLAESLKRVIPFGRLGTAEDIAPVVVFLASDESGFVTGQTLSVSGGLTMV
ncbi:MAG TPA: 3-oxoacyl-ACP reductase family protein, partial [Candidatus Nitrosocosmicus sp.]|jgi:2-hydroxycyclohexanecarboxyl-CoA dehydrogenase|nr:3-oxoacyl-ACP reductase family protein [Candidatus Nitrosocosmicus sp.]